MRGTTAGDMWKLRGHFLLPALELSDFPEFLDATGFSVTSFWWLLQIQNQKIPMIPDLFQSGQVSPILQPSNRQGTHLLDAASGLKFILALASGLPVDALSTPGLFDAIGWFTDEELVETVDVRFIAVGFELFLTFVKCHADIFSSFPIIFPMLPLHLVFSLLEA